jgi:mRNA interferase RelE/StbE
MRYEVKWTDISLRQMKKLPKDAVKRIIEKVESISKDPFMFVSKLKGFDLYKLRVGDYRVIMSIEKKKMIIFVLEVGHRSIIYRKY